MTNYNFKTVSIPAWAEAYNDAAYAGAGTRKTRVDNIEDAYALVPLFYRGVRIRCNSLTNIPRHIYDARDNEIEWAKLFPVDLDWLLWQTQAAQILKGGSVIVKVTNSGRKIINLQWINPNSITITWDAQNQARLFQQTATNTVGGSARVWRESEVIFVREFSLTDEIGFGVPSAGVALVASRTAFSEQRIAAQFFESGAMPATIVTTAAPVGEAERERVQGFFGRKLTGIANFARVLVLSGQDIKFSTTQSTLREMVIPELMDMARKDVARALELPVTLLDSDETYATAAEHRQQYYRDTVIPAAKQIQAAMNRDLFDAMGLRFEFAPEEMDIFQTDESARATSYTTYVNAGVPPRVAAALLGIDVPEDVSEVWEKYLAESETPKPEPTPPAAPIEQEDSAQDDAEDAQEDEGEAAQNKSIELARFHRVAKKSVKRAQAFRFEHLAGDEIAQVYTSAKIAPAYGSDGHRAMMKRFDARVEKQQAKMRAAVTDLFEWQARDMQKRLRANFKSETKKETQEQLAAYLRDIQNADYEEAFAEKLTPIIKEIIRAAAIETISDYGLGIAFDILDPNVNKFIAQRAQRFAEQVNETTWQQVKDNLMQGVTNGESIPQLAARIESVMQDRIRSSGETIARTETISAANYGTLETWAQSGVVSKKVWLSTLDPRTRTYDAGDEFDHVEPHGQARGLDEAFDVSGESLMYPGDSAGSAGNVINCRCTMTAEVS